MQFFLGQPKRQNLSYVEKIWFRSDGNEGSKRRNKRETKKGPAQALAKLYVQCPAEKNQTKTAVLDDRLEHQKIIGRCSFPV